MILPLFKIYASFILCLRLPKNLAVYSSDFAGILIPQISWKNSLFKNCIYFNILIFFSLKNIISVDKPIILTKSQTLKFNWFENYYNINK